MMIATAIDKLGATLAEVYPKFQDYAKVSILYIAAAGVMIQVIKSMRG